MLGNLSESNDQLTYSEVFRKSKYSKTLITVTALNFYLKYKGQSSTRLTHDSKFSNKVKKPVASRSIARIPATSKMESFTKIVNG